MAHDDDIDDLWDEFLAGDLDLDEFINRAFSADAEAGKAIIDEIALDAHDRRVLYSKAHGSPIE